MPPGQGSPRASLGEEACDSELIVGRRWLTWWWGSDEFEFIHFVVVELLPFSIVKDNAIKAGVGIIGGSLAIEVSHFSIHLLSYLDACPNNVSLLLFWSRLIDGWARGSTRGRGG